MANLRTILTVDDSATIRDMLRAALTELGVTTTLDPTGLVTATTYLDTNTAPALVWHYQVAAVDASGNESAPSAGASAERMGADVAPAAPAGLTAAGGYAGNALAWTANTESDLSGYNVYRAGQSFRTRTNNWQVESGSVDLVNASVRTQGMPRV